MSYSHILSHIDSIEAHIITTATNNHNTTTTNKTKHSTTTDLEQQQLAQLRQEAIIQSNLNKKVGIVSRKILQLVDKVLLPGRYLPGGNGDVQQQQQQSSSVTKNTHGCLFQEEILWPEASDSLYPRLVEKLSALKKFQGEHTKQLHVKNTLLVTHEAHRALYEFLWRHPEVEELDLSQVRGFDIWLGIRLGHALYNHGGLKVLRLEACDAGVNALAALFLAVHQSRTLEVLDVSQTGVLETGATFLAAVLKNNGIPNLKELNIAKCNIGVTGAIALSSVIESHDNLRILNIGGNNIHAAGANALVSALATKNTLQELDIQKNSIRSEGTHALQQWIERSNCSLHKVKLSENLIGHVGARGLAVALARNTSVKEFIFSKNFCGVEGSGFGMCLSQNSTLETLDLTKNDVNDDSCGAIVTGLHMNVTLKHLRLNGEVVLSNRGAIALGKFLANPKCHLEILDLAGNDIRDEGAIALGEALTTNTSLKTLFLQNNSIQDDGGKALGLGLKHSQTLQILDVSNNPINKELIGEYFSDKRRKTIIEHRRRSSLHSTDGNTTGLVLLHDGTESATQNLKDYGIVFGQYRVGWQSGLFAIFMAFILAVFGLVSNIYLVAVNAIQGEYVYAAFVATFLFVPLLYFALFLSHPRAFAGEGGRGHANKTRYESFINQMQLGVDTKGWSLRRGVLAVVSIIGMRIPYELYLSWREGSTTLDLESCELVWAVIHSTPIALVQAHEIWTSLALKNLLEVTTISEQLATVNSGNRALVVAEEYDIMIALIVAILNLSSTFSKLFERRDVYNWAVRTTLHDDTAKTIGSTISLIYHLAHWVARLMTLSLCAAIFAPVLCTALFALSAILRVGIWGWTQSKRHINFCLVTFVVGTNAWDTRLAVRLNVLLEFLEAGTVIGVLWVPNDQVLALVKQYPSTLLNMKLIEIHNTVGDGSISIALAVTLGVATIIHFAFLERIRVKGYKDVGHFHGSFVMGRGTNSNNMKSANCCM
jgi:Ran GTPase-activating protein (RanGAP) involved in mRNA processing and transport